MAQGVSINKYFDTKELLYYTCDSGKRKTGEIFNRTWYKSKMKVFIHVKCQKIFLYVTINNRKRV